MKKTPRIRIPRLLPSIAVKVKIQQWLNVRFSPPIRIASPNAHFKHFEEAALGKRARLSMCRAHSSRASRPAQRASRLSRAGSTRVRFPTSPRSRVIRLSIQL